jgi:hypothetical protein
MFGRRSRGLFIAAVVASALVASVQPVFADKELGHTGTVGNHSLTDTAGDPGAVGKYRYYPSDGFGWLKRFRVDPPNVKAVAGESAQTVGWRFTVERKVCGLGGCDIWRLRYTSPEQTAVTDDATNAAFTKMAVSVKVPCGHNCADAGAIYRINVKMIWHRPNGNVQGTALHRIYWYGAEMDTGESGVIEKHAWDSWSPDWT